VIVAQYHPSSTSTPPPLLPSLIAPLRRALPFVLLPALLVAGARSLGPVPALGGLLDPAHGAWALARSAELPRSANSIIEELQQSVEVRYDRRGVPHIFAANEEDAYRALGYVVARDRLFQLWVQTMAAAGRLTELAGSRALPLDREMRRLGLTWSAEQKLAAFDTTARSVQLISAYAEGVNAYIERLPRDERPLEFRLLGIDDIPPWDPLNSILLLNRMGWTLAYLTPELDRARAAARVGAAAAASLFPENSPIQEPIQPSGAKSARYDFTHLAPPGAPDTTLAPVLVAALEDFLPGSSGFASTSDEERRDFASNNWAVSPRRTAAGHALLAGDPHLELTLPSIWYEAHLVVPGSLDVYGVTIPGAPGIVIGFNRDVAWSFTNTSADVLDFYTEKVDDEAHPTKYQVDNEWRPLEQRIERYRGRDGEVLATDTLYFTHRGPMRRERGRWLSMRWTVLERSNEAAAFSVAARAHDADEFQREMGRYFWSPAQNMIAMDRRGTISIRSTGHFPIRPGGGSGFAVRDGSLSTNDWRGYLPPEFYPQSRDPAQGFLASANQQPIDPKASPYWLGGEYDPWRAVRINQLLRADSAMTVDKFRAMQTDPGSARADYFVPFFLSAANAVAARGGGSVDVTKLREAANLLEQWDRKYTKENRRAVLFEAAYRELVDRTWDELASEAVRLDARGGGSSTRARAITPSSPILAELLSDSASIWWDDQSTPERIETRDDILAASLVTALDSTKARYGSPAGNGWAWSRIRHANVWHTLRLKSMSALELPVQGGPSTLSPSSGSGVFGASWRMIVEAAPNEFHAWGTYPGGQSGNPASSRYRDRMRSWLAGELQPLATPSWIPNLADSETSSRLTLRPEK
jgi:penicillin amidase